MFSTVFLLLIYHTNLLFSLQNIRVADTKILHDSKYIPASHLHRISTSAVDSLHDCVYLCHNNDYCRTANYYEFETDLLCALFEENSYVGRIVSVSSIVSVVISFNLCPNGYSEPEFICFGLPKNIQPPITIQNILTKLRLVQQWSVLTYYPIILSTRFYVPLFTTGTLQIYEWPSLNYLYNITFPLSSYSFDMNLHGEYLLTSLSYDLYFYSTERNWTSDSSTYYPAVLSDRYIAVLSNGNSKIYIHNSTTGDSLFNLTISSTVNWWARIINEQLYISSTTGLRRIDLAQGTSAVPVVLVANLTCKQMFFDASGRIYLEKNDGTKVNSFVYDTNGRLLASYTNGSRLIGKASKYTFYLLNNLENPLLFYQYP